MSEEQPEVPVDADENVVDDVDAHVEDVLADDPSVPVTTETGHAAVDEVLRSLSALDSAAVDDHVAVFEQAHEQLRRTLSGAGDDQA